MAIVDSTVAVFRYDQTLNDHHEPGWHCCKSVVGNRIETYTDPDTPDPPEDAMTQKQRIDGATALMMAFAERTGLSSDGQQRRYLWTDSFAVCNFLGLARTSGEHRFLELALRLIDRVHQQLGRHRSDDVRSGWLGVANEQHPTRGGLRIGKSLPERTAHEPMDERLEWDRDGQYFHYLTKWMQALDQAARVTPRSEFNLWSRELAEAAHEAFTYQPDGGTRRMYWKMSIDLSRPLVPSMGHHDPLDGYVTAVQLGDAAMKLNISQGPALDDAMAQYETMIAGGDWSTADPLGLGGLLMDANRVEQLMHHGRFSGEKLLERLLSAALSGLRRFAAQHDNSQSAAYRLAFRELGLAIGLAAVDRMWTAHEEGRFSGSATTRDLLVLLQRHAGLRGDIESFWLEADHRHARSWIEHRDINEVMLATSLLPDGCLVLPAVN